MCASERAESMRNTTRFGFFGFVASMCFFCLSTVTGSPHDSKPTDPLNPAAREDPLLLLTNAPFLHQLQEQNLAVLKALEQLREEREGALDRYNQTITSQLNILKDAFLFQGGVQIVHRRGPLDEPHSQLFVAAGDVQHGVAHPQQPRLAGGQLFTGHKLLHDLRVDRGDAVPDEP